MSDRDDVRKQVIAALGRVRHPDSQRDVLSTGVARELQLTPDGTLSLELVLGPSDPPELAVSVRQALQGIAGVERLELRVETDSAGPGAGRPGGGARAGRRGRSLPIVGQGEGAGASPREAPQGSRPRPRGQAAASRRPSEAEPLAGVGRVLAVSSGKGGVGKSTVATNLAAALAEQDLRVGLMDADVYGPNIPVMFGVHEKPRVADEKVVPLERHGVKLMSIGFLVDEDTPAIWRGPIIQGIVRQFLQQVVWGELDYLIVDLPPGTGDAQLSLCQLVKVDGAVMVTTPQDVAVGDVLKGIRMFQTLEVPVLGIVENMSGFVCPDCGSRHEIFGSGGGEKLAAALGIPFLGAVPLGTAMREEGDRGAPTVLGRPGSPEGQALKEVARRVLERCEALGAEMATS